jgi:hypothetical protein
MRLATQGAPMPVQTIAIGDPAVMAGNAVTLLVHASVTKQGQDRLLAFSVRPYRSSDQGVVLFGAVPQVAEIPSSAAGGAALDAALARALSETLPWAARSQSTQPIEITK